MQFEISAKKINKAITVANFRKTYYSFVKTCTKIQVRKNEIFSLTCDNEIINSY